MRALIHAAKELGLHEGTIVTADVEKKWTLEGTSITALPLYQFLIWFLKNKNTA